MSNYKQCLMFIGIDDDDIACFCLHIFSNKLILFAFYEYSY